MRFWGRGPTWRLLIPWQVYSRAGLDPALIDDARAVDSASQAMSKTLTAIGALAFSTGVGGAQAVNVTRIGDEPSCRDCVVVVRQVAVVGQADGPGALSDYPLAIAADRLGRYWVATSANELAKVYDRDGTFLREVGSVGRGPGEFIDPIDVVVIPGDSVLIVDGAQRRAVLVGPDLVPVRSVMTPLYARPTVVVAWPESVWMNGALPTPESAGWPLHRMSLASGTAQHVVSFGPGTGELRPGQFDRLWQWLAVSTVGRVWSADRLRYHFTLWAANGEMLRAYDRRPPWFAVESEASMGSRRTPPPPAVAAIHEDSTGLLWTFVNVPSDSWQTGWTNARRLPVRSGSGATFEGGTTPAIERLWSTIVEVIDPQTARVVARHKVPEWLFAALPDRRAAAVVSDEDGVLRIAVFQLSLRGCDSSHRGC